jgi:hypothetical protein
MNCFDGVAIRPLVQGDYTQQEGLVLNAGKVVGVPSTLAKYGATTPEAACIVLQQADIGMTTT